MAISASGRVHQGSLESVIVWGERAASSSRREIRFSRSVDGVISALSHRIWNLLRVLIGSVFMAGKAFILLLSSFLIFPASASATRVAFVEVRKWNGDKLILEPGFP